MQSIYHICPKTEWENARRTGSLVNNSLVEEGFIHCSRIEQIPEVARRFFHGIPNLLLLEIDLDKLSAEVRWELVGDQRFPHVYGPLNLDAIIGVQDLTISRIE